MTGQERSPRYTAVAIALHWAMAGLLVGMIFLGWNMSDHEGREIEWLFQLHKSIGITLLLLTIARIIWRVMNPPPPLPEMKDWEARLSHFVHMAFYAVMILVPLGGWALASMAKVQVPTVLYETVSWPHLPVAALGAETKAGIYPIAEFLHSKSAYLIFALLALHVGGALKHEISEEDGVLKRMIPGLFGKTDGPQAPPRGFLTAFGAAIGAFVLVAGLPLAANALQTSGDLKVTGTTGIAPNWQVDQDASSITFSGIHDGNAFTGAFGNWSAQIFFDSSNLSTSDVLVEIDMTDVSASKKLYTDSLSAPEWFGVADWPQASVRLSDFAATGDGYSATATLRLKGNEVAAPFTFTLIEGDASGKMDGTAVFSRKALGLGQDSDPKAEWVSDEVTVTVAVEATRTR